jgi:nickel-dependent lactate racemase
VATSREVYGVPLHAQADIVIAGSHPCDIEFWQAHKSLYPADLAVRAGGTVIVVTPSPEGVPVSHHDMLNFTGLPSERIDTAITDGTIRDVVSGAVALAWAKMRERACISLVSGGIPDEEARGLGFEPYPSVEDALAAALRRHGSGASINVLPYAPETLPL